ncbi:MAG: ribonuclease D [Rhodospirillaceae bacterium]|nr:ribonuclease D [Rhodospirillaceae bacterium]HAA93463.1 ribonuclease D [Rhodospirillaceae bacterium]
MVPITDSETLAAFCTRQKGTPFLTVDTEFMRERTYYPILCLIQIGGADEAVIIDPLADGIDLTPLYDLMRDNSILKVFHAARQDMEIFFYKMDELPGPIFDTQLAAMVCGFGDQIGYEPLVARITGARMNKQSRFSDWSRRPLSPQQLDYALGDVTHLRTVYEALAEQLDESGRTRWLDEEMAILTATETYDANPSTIWQRIKSRSTEPRFLAVLQAVAAWREREAQRRDIPRNRIARDDTLLDLAARAPKNLDELGRTRGLSNGFSKGKGGEILLKAIATGKAVPRDKAPVKKTKPPLPPGIGPVTELLKVMLKQCSEQSGVASRLIASVGDLELIAADDNANVRALKGWRRDLFGDQALALKRGELAIAVENNSIRLITQKQS